MSNLTDQLCKVDKNIASWSNMSYKLGTKEDSPVSWPTVAYMSYMPGTKEDSPVSWPTVTYMSYMPGTKEDFPSIMAYCSLHELHAGHERRLPQYHGLL